MDNKETECIIVKIKCSKANKTKKPEIVTVYATGSYHCPVKAVKKYLAINKALGKNDPFFILPCGKPLTGKFLNYQLDNLLNIYLCNGRITGHSFRSGLISIFARQDFTDEQLKKIGRWSSRAYERYIKLGRTKRNDVALLIRKC